MLHLANMMEYEDDFDDQNLYNENRRRQDTKKTGSKFDSSDDEESKRPKIVMQ